MSLSPISGLSRVGGLAASGGLGIGGLSTGGATPPPPPPPPVYPLDGVTSPVLAISTARRLTGAYTGPLLRVMNAAGVEQSIPYNAGNELDTTALLAHTGTGATDTGRIVRAHGQAGTIDGMSVHAAQLPWIVQAGVMHTIGGRPGCRAQSTSASWQTTLAGTSTAANLTAALQPDFTWLLVLIAPTSEWLRDFYRGSPNGVEVYSVAPTSHFRTDVAGVAISSADGTNLAGSTVRVYAGRRSGGSAVEVYRNAEGTPLLTGTQATALDATPYILFSGQLNRTYAEMYWWNSAIPLSELNALRTNCTNYFGATYP